MPRLSSAEALSLAPPAVGEALLGLTEDQWFDRKSVRVSPVKLAEAEISFANAEGGTIVIGVSSGAVEGTDSFEKHRNDLIQAAIDSPTHQCARGPACCRA